MIAVEQQSFEDDVDCLLNSYSPINRSNERRREVVSFVRDVVTRRLERSFLIECGSSALKSYLPESDLDLVLLSPGVSSGRDEMNLLTGIFNALCTEVSDKEEGESAYLEMTIRNVEFVNARTKLAHCLVNNIAVDITINQVGAMTALAFLEEVDLAIGYNHLFKRSVLLVKSWCQHESAKYCGVPVLGAKVGMLSSYSISVMVLHLFNKFSANLMHPFSVLRSFFYTYSLFPWDTHVLTLEGPQPIVFGGGSSNSSGGSGAGVTEEFCSSGASVQSEGSASSCGRRSRAGNGATHTRSFNLNDPKYMVYTNRFTELLQQYRNHPAQIACSAAKRQNSYKGGNQKFTIRCCNIQDPIDATNNLGISVSRMNLQLIRQAFRCGYQHLENSLAHYAVAVAAAKMEMQQQQQLFLQQQLLQQQQQCSGAEIRARLEPVSPQNLGFIGSPSSSDGAISTTAPVPASTTAPCVNAAAGISSSHCSDGVAIENSSCVNTTYSTSQHLTAGEQQQYDQWQQDSYEQQQPQQYELQSYEQQQNNIASSSFEQQAMSAAGPGVDNMRSRSGSAEVFIASLAAATASSSAATATATATGFNQNADTDCVGIASIADQMQLQQQQQSLSPERPLSSSFTLGSHQQAVVSLGMFLQEFFPILLNVYGGANALCGGGGGAAAGSSGSFGTVMRHDLMEHPLQAVAASRGQGTVLFGNSSWSSRSGKKRSNSSNSRTSNVYSTQQQSQKQAQQQQQQQGAIADSGTPAGDGSVVSTTTTVVMSDGGSVCSDATEATGSTAYGFGLSELPSQQHHQQQQQQYSQQLFDDEQDLEDADPLIGDLVAMQNALRIAAFVHSPVLGVKFSAFSPLSPPASTPTAAAAATAAAVINEYDALVAEVGHMFSSRVELGSPSGGSTAAESTAAESGCGTDTCTSSLHGSPRQQQQQQQQQLSPPHQLQTRPRPLPPHDAASATAASSLVNVTGDSSSATMLQLLDGGDTSSGCTSTCNSGFSSGCNSGNKTELINGVNGEVPVAQDGKISTVVASTASVPLVVSAVVGGGNAHTGQADSGDEGDRASTNSSTDSNHTSIESSGVDVDGVAHLECKSTTCLPGNNKHSHTITNVSKKGKRKSKAKDNISTTGVSGAVNQTSEGVSSIDKESSAALSRHLADASFLLGSKSKTYDIDMETAKNIAGRNNGSSYHVESALSDSEISECSNGSCDSDSSCASDADLDGELFTSPVSPAQSTLSVELTMLRVTWFMKKLYRRARKAMRRVILLLKTEVDVDDGIRSRLARSSYTILERLLRLSRSRSRSADIRMKSYIADRKRGQRRHNQDNLDNQDSQSADARNTLALLRSLAVALCYSMVMILCVNACFKINLPPLLHTAQWLQWHSVESVQSQYGRATSLSDRVSQYSNSVWSNLMPAARHTEMANSKGEGVEWTAPEKVVTLQSQCTALYSLSSPSSSAQVSDSAAQRVGHWVRLGDSISFGDFSSYESSPQSQIQTPKYSKNTKSSKLNLHAKTKADKLSVEGKAEKSAQKSQQKPVVGSPDSMLDKKLPIGTAGISTAAMGRAALSVGNEPLIPWGEDSSITIVSTSARSSSTDDASHSGVTATKVPAGIGKGMQDLYTAAQAPAEAAGQGLSRGPEQGVEYSWGDLPAQEVVTAGPGASTAPEVVEVVIGEDHSSHPDSHTDIEPMEAPAVAAAVADVPEGKQRQQQQVEVLYQWTKDGKNVTNVMGNVPYFSLRRSRLSDAGRYQCFKHLVVTKSSSLHQSEAPAPVLAPELIVDTNIQISREPKVRTRPSYQEVAPGSTVLLSLSADGIPPPTFQWYKNGYKMPGQTAAALVMDAVNTTHSGTYSCEVQNIAASLVWLEATVVVV